MARFRIRTTVEKTFDTVVEAEDADKARALATTNTVKRETILVEVSPVTDDALLGDVT